MRLRASCSGSRRSVSTITRAVMLTLVGGGATMAQTWFVNPDPPLGGIGTDGTNLMFNADADPDLETFPVPADLLPTSQAQFFFTPSRQMIYAVKLLPDPPRTSPPCTLDHDVRVFVFHINLQTDSGGILETVHDGVCMGEIADRGFFDPPAGPHRIAFVSERTGSTGTSQRVLFINLNAVNDSTVRMYSHDIGFIRFAPTGVAAFVQHDLTSGQPGADYTFNCLDPGAFGEQLAMFDVLAGPAADAALELGPQNEEVIHIYHDEIPPAAAFIGLEECGPAMPEMGPCCYTSNQTCTVDLSALDCADGGGTWLGPNADCADCPAPEPEGACCHLAGFCSAGQTQLECAVDDPESTWLQNQTCSACPQVDFVLTRTGPSEVDAGDFIVYTLEYENVGNTDATNTVLRDYSVPDPTLPVVPSDNGEHIPGTSEVVWNLGTVPQGATGQVTLAVGTGCTTFSPVTAVPGSAVIQSDYGGFNSNSGTVQTVVNPYPDDPLVATLTSMPSAGLPLFSGDLLTHSVELTNPIAETRPGVHFSVQWRDDVQEFLDTVDEAGGSVDSQFGFNWTGDVGPNETITVVFRTRIRDCLDQSVENAILNFGDPFDVLDVCDNVVATLTPAGPLPVQPSFTGKLTAINLPPPTELITFISTERVQVARDGDQVVLQLDMVNHQSTPLAVDLQFYLPFGLDVVADPPFIAPTDIQAVYDDASRRVTWSGEIGPGETRLMTMDTVIDLPFDSICRLVAFPNVTGGECADLAQSLVIDLLPEPPTVPHIAGYTGFEGELWWMSPASDEQFEYFLCGNEEFTTDIAITTNGEIWMTGAPFYRFNPLTGELEGFGPDFYDTLDLDVGSINQAAGDPTDNSVILQGSRSDVNGMNTMVAYRRYDSRTRSVIPLPDLGQGFINDMIVDRQGRVILAGAVPSGLARVDLATPDSPEPMLTSSTYAVQDLDLDTDDDYLALAADFMTGAKALIEVDSLTQAVTVHIPDLRSAIAPNWFANDLTVSPTGEIYISDAFGGLAEVLRDPPVLNIIIEQDFTGFGRPMQGMVFLDPSASLVLGDCDDNGTVNLADWALVQACVTGPDASMLPPGCTCADVNNSSTVDLRDLQVQQSAFDGIR